MTTDEKWEKAADMGADAVIAFFKYQGDNPKYYRDAKIGIGAGSIFVKKFSANNNREQLRLEAEKMALGKKK